MPKTPIFWFSRTGLSYYMIQRVAPPPLPNNPPHSRTSPMPRASLPTSLARKGALILGLIAGLGSVSAAMAQQAQIAFGNLAQDTDLPVSVEADQLRVDNADGTAVFSGNV